MVRNPTAVVIVMGSDAELVSDSPRSSVIVRLYNFTVPKLCGNHRLGMLSSIVQFAVSQMGVLTSELAFELSGEMAFRGMGSDLRLSSAMDSVNVGEAADTAEWIPKVTLT